ncbi:MAG: hypothetical protein U5K29_02685 [Acidimicrobiales bacterium]|nr:hypothetical protein [Acidimicrobiales bacterium]
MKRSIRTLGYEVRRSQLQPVRDLSDLGNDPITAQYLCDPARIDAPIVDGRGLWFHPLTAEKHPFVATALELAVGRNFEGQPRRCLDTFYAMSQPASFAEWTGVGESNPTLAQTPAWGIAMPWVMDRSVAEQQYVMAGVYWREASLAGQALPISEFYPLAGPLSEQGIQIELDRLASIVESLQTSGYVNTDADDGDIEAWWLTTSGRDWTWCIGVGQHRAAAVAALGAEHVPVRVRGIVRRSDARAWPGVVRGYFTVAEAEALFDLIVSGELPPLARQWADTFQAP